MDFEAGERTAPENSHSGGLSNEKARGFLVPNFRARARQRPYRFRFLAVLPNFMPLCVRTPFAPLSTCFTRASSKTAEYT